MPVMRRFSLRDGSSRHGRPGRLRLRLTTDRPWAAIAVRLSASTCAGSVVGGNMMLSLVYSWLATSTARVPRSPSSGIRSR